MAYYSSPTLHSRPSIQIIEPRHLCNELVVLTTKNLLDLN